MRNDCLDIGTIQAFMDCELTHEESARVSAHIALCDACACSLAEAEEETAVVFPALEREMDTLVPTQRLWNRINDTITLEQSRRPRWQKAWAALGAPFISFSPSMAVAASVVIVVGITAMVLMNRGPVPQNDVAGVGPQQNGVAAPSSSQTSNTIVTSSDPGTTASTVDPTATGPKVDRATYRSEQRPMAVKTVYNPRSAQPAYLPGEESYVKTINTLAKSVDEAKENVLGASERVAFERDMAIVNYSISKLRKEVKKHPRNDSAKQVLYSSYQNKIDLLNSVAQKQEMMATLVD